MSATSAPRPSHFDDIDARAARILRKRRARSRAMDIRSARMAKSALRFLTIAFA